MITWLVQEYADVPGLQAGQPAPGLLSAAGWWLFATLRVEKRRHEWLLGRWTAKRLLVCLFREEAGAIVPPASFSILNDGRGAPCIAAADGLGELASGWRLSISHSRERALCAAGRVEYLGADLEWIEPRPPGFAAEYLTEEELSCLAGISADMEAVTLNAIWSGKEAALKALRVGLHVDTRAVSCLLSPPSGLPDGWQPFAIHLDARLLALEEDLTKRLGPMLPNLCGWWRVNDGYVYTLVMAPGERFTQLVL